MKRIVEEANEGMESLLGEDVTLLCANYFYTGRLVGANDTCVKLEKPSLIYETGPWSDKSWKDAQSLCVDYIYVQTGAIEAFGVMK